MKKHSSASGAAAKKKKKAGKSGKAPANAAQNTPNPKGGRGPKKGKNTGDLHPSVLISGYYGFDNLGDELILKVLVDELKARQVKITVLSQNPKKTAAQYGVNAIKRTSFIDVVDALASANLFISGGGGLFQDATGPMSSVYYGGLIHLARFFDVPVVFWAQGVGPLKQSLSRKMTASAIKKCEKVLVRDEKSALLVESLVGSKPEITADPVWLLKPAALGTKPQSKSKSVSPKSDSTSWQVGLSLRPWHELTPDRLTALADCLNALAEQREGPVCFKLLPFQRKEDTELLETFSRQLNTSARIAVEMVTPDAVLETLGSCDIVLGMRFHSLILGLLYNIPVYGLIYDPKVASLLTMFELKGTTIAALKTISPDALQAALDQYPVINLKPFQKKSRQNITVLEQLLDIPASKLVL